jgi:succinate-semialdehyde dehydrogenase / glutarate-semialdehyde dehydrogenase
LYRAPLSIDGHEIDRTAAPRFEVINPATEEALGTAPSAGSEEVAAALAAAKRGLTAWGGVSALERSTVLRRIAALMRERIDEIAMALTLEIGKPLAEGRTEVTVAAEYFDWAAEETRRIAGYSRNGRLPGSRFEVSHAPVGIVLALTAWNFPVGLASRKLSMALGAGCAVILRPAEEAPACVSLLVRCCVDAGLPPGAVSLLHGAPEAVVAPFMAEPAVRQVSFTGSTRVGQILIRQSADTVKRLTMELGGHAPFIVLEDADVEKAAAAAVMSKLRNAGQVCTAATRFLVHDKVCDEFTTRMAAIASAVRLGDGRQEGVQMGPLTTSRQRAHAERLVQDARDKGARVVCGGGRPPGFNRGFFFEPTVLADVPENADILTIEPFSPLAAIVRVSGADEAIGRANALEYGLAAYVFSRSENSINAVIKKLEAGVIGANNVAVAVPEAPFGGVKQSGYGREGGEEGIYDFLETKFVHRVPA